jgi:hypothetical protein
MLQVSPLIELSVPCPECAGRLLPENVHFAGIPVFAECTCSSCHNRYWVDLPAGHALLHPTVISEDERVYFDGLDWYSRLLQTIFQSRSDAKPGKIRVRSRPSGTKAALIVNCLDTLYGHSLLKFLSSLHYLRRAGELDVIPIIPSSLAWMLPPMLQSVIEVDAPLASFGSWIGGLDAAVKSLLSLYSTTYLAEAVSQPDLSSVDLSILGPEFMSKGFWQFDCADQKQLTIVAREDRLWIGSERLLPAIRRRPFLPRRIMQSMLVRYQNWKFVRLARQAQQVIPNLRVVIVGLGRTGSFPKEFVDLRQASMTAASERLWCAEYARSHVVLGVHGSNMLLPSALAGAVVDLLPRFKLRNITQDLIIRDEREPKLCLFRYRVLPLATRPRIVADTVISVFKDAQLHFSNVIGNRITAERSGWPRSIRWKRLGEAHPVETELPPLVNADYQVTSAPTS